MGVLTSSGVFVIFTQGAHLREDVMKNMEANEKKKREHAQLAPQGVEQSTQHDAHQQGLHPHEIVGWGATSSSSTSNKCKGQQVRDEQQHPNPMMGRWVREQLACT